MSLATFVVHKCQSMQPNAENIIFFIGKNTKLNDIMKSNVFLTY